MRIECRIQRCAFAWLSAVALSACAFAVSAAEIKTSAEPELSGPLKAAQAAAGKGDFASAIKLLTAEAEKGDADAANGLGEFMLAGRGGKATPAAAAKLFQQAADKGHSAAAFNLAQLLEQGAEGVPKDSEKAEFLYRNAAEAGFASAQYRMGAKLEPSATRSEDKQAFKDARIWYEKAAAQKQPEALLALVRFYDAGLGELSADAVRAANLCIQAAKAGSVIAMNEMGVRYQKGLGLANDNVAAIGWFTLAAQYHLPAANINLGHCYEQGNGLMQDYNQAGAHYYEAANMNDPQGQFMLGRLFENGKGTEVDLVKAYVLYSKAADGKIADAAERRDAVKIKLSGAQLVEAEKLIAEKPGEKTAPGGEQK